MNKWVKPNSSILKSGISLMHLIPMYEEMMFPLCGTLSRVNSVKIWKNWIYYLLKVIKIMERPKISCSEVIPHCDYNQTEKRNKMIATDFATTGSCLESRESLKITGNRFYSPNARLPNLVNFKACGSQLPEFPNQHGEILEIEICAC